MKNYYFSFFSLVITIIVSSGLYAQEAIVTGGCSTVTVSDIPDFPNVVTATGWGSVFSQNTNPPSCRQAAVQGPSTMKPRFILQKKNTSGSFVNVQTVIQNEGHQFTGLSKGVYRVNVTTPFFDIETCNGSGNRLTQVFFTNNQFFGVKGSYNWESSDGPVLGQEGFSENSNEVVVGFTTQNDITISFNEAGSSTSSTSFQENDDVILDLSQSTCFDRYFIAIQQTAGGTNYQSRGWQEGHIEDYDLTALWTNNGTRSGWRFWNGGTFRVQVVLENTSCRNGVWNQKFLSFSTCSSGMGCRFTLPETETVSTFPNPFNDYFVFRDLTMHDDRNYEISIVDMSGKEVFADALTTNFVKPGRLAKGIYIVTVTDNMNNVFRTKIASM